MPTTPERAAALAALFRALAAMLARLPETPPLIDWGAVLHDHESAGGQQACHRGTVCHSRVPR